MRDVASFLLAVIALTAVAAGRAPAQSLDPDSLDRRRAALVAEVRSAFRPAHEYGGAPGIAVVVSGAPVVLPPDWTIDVETGNGHGAALNFLRFQRRGVGVDVEEVVWRSRTIVRKGPPVGFVRRARLTEEEVRPLVEAVVVLPTLVVREAERPETEGFPRVGGCWMSSNDFRVQVRLLGDGGAPLFTRTFTGCESSDSQFEYLALEAVIHVARGVLPGDERFRRLPPDQLRSSHFGAAFVLDEPHLTDDLCWWVLEESVEALGHFGTSATLPALERLRARARGPRIGEKLDALPEDPVGWLTGPPRFFSE